MKNKDYLIILFLTIIFIIIFIDFSYKFNFAQKFEVYISFLEFKKECENIEGYLKLCNNLMINYKKYKKKKYPNVSIISAVYNREKYISRFLRSIQNQNYKNFEIILIDDNSLDNSVEIIKKNQKFDKRIILIKHKANRGTFICRNVGVLYSRGNYIILPDPDDILSKDIINICYNFVSKYNYEMIRFNMYIGENQIFLNNAIKKLEVRPIYQPELSTYLFIRKGKVGIIDYNVANKYIKKVAYIRALNILNNYYLNSYIIICEDQIMNYILYRTVKSFYFLKKIGYYYIRNNQKVRNNIFKKKEHRMKNWFIFLNIVLEYSKNTKNEKIMANIIFKKLNKRFNIKYRLSNLNQKDIIFYYDIINKCIKCDFILKENKIKLKKFKNIL